ncbi:unnamed protein product [Brachionus calyciflorus]|uniref:Ig-like domain-containing protein n=1 Tax=Brachionus calyciflorus TaxID=104777 RepID=A0A813SRJ5_9BILA|nr:unnamed protein product [Brachionus calyciflorus]
MLMNMEYFISCLLMIFDSLLGLEVIHNKAYFITSTNIIKPNKILNVYENQIKSSKKLNRNIIPTTTKTATQPTKQTILKIYQNNLTVNYGESLNLDCPFKTNSNIKTVIWSKDLPSPRIISNNQDLYSRSNRYYLNNKTFSLKICPILTIDTGWYSCYIVKQSILEQNEKYLIYINVNTDEISNDFEYDDADYSDELSEKCNQLQSATSVLKDTSLKRQIDQNKTKKNEEIEEKIFLLSETTKKAHKFLENLKVNPKYLKVNEFASFQLDCVYNGVKFLNMTLKWFKNNNELIQENDQRYVFVNYMQNNTNIKILKFSFAITTDSGYYKCLPFTRANVDNGKIMEIENSDNLVSVVVSKATRSEEEFVLSKFDSNFVIKYLINNGTFLKLHSTRSSRTNVKLSRALGSSGL